MRTMTDRLGIMLLRILALTLMATLPAHAAEPTHYVVGELDAKTPTETSPGLLLMGGGDRNHEALRWFTKKAGGGHIVVLRTSQGGEIGQELFKQLGGIVSAETFVFHDRDAASDPAILARIKRADGILIAGDDQARYVNYWRGTPLSEVLETHVRDGKPLAGSSAGLAILDKYVYSAMGADSQSSRHALVNSLGRDVIEAGFLHLNQLKGVITAPHFSAPDRLGRLIAFVAEAEQMAGHQFIGLGVDEGAALAVDADGTARLYATTEGTGARVILSAEQEGQSTRFARVKIVGIGPDSILHLPSGRVEKPAFEQTWTVRDGVLAALDSPRLVIHGGAGVERAGLSAEDAAVIRETLEAALRAGYAQLTQGKPAMEAVSAAITVLEDAPQFNAGRGAVFTHEGRNELDSSVMDGASGKAGAVAGVRRVKNPILLARKVMEASRHVMMIGTGAETFAEEQGVELVDPTYFRTEKRWDALQKILKLEAAAQEHEQTLPEPPGKAYFGTVGALALDVQGHLAAGTSTGGMTNKRYGRVGDAPIIGAGTWADARCAVSGTGWGEFYIRAAAAHDICARVAYAGQSLQQAADTVINQLIPAAGGDGGAIALGADGSMAFPFNTEGMYRGWIGVDGVPHVAIFADEALSLP